MLSNRDRNVNEEKIYRYGWSFDRKIQVGVLITLLVMFITLIGSIFQGGYRTAEQIGRITNLEIQVKTLVDNSTVSVTQPIRIDNLEGRMLAVEKTLDIRGEFGQQYASRLSVLEAQFIDFKKAIDRIEINVGKIADREYIRK